MTAFTANLPRSTTFHAMAERADTPGDHPPPVATAPNVQRLPQLDGLRGLAAISVMLYHVHSAFRLTLGFERAYLFVDVFFMLSGFVLSRAWSPDFGRDLTVGTLLKARLHRLWPTIAAAAILGAAVHALLDDRQNIPMLLLLALLVIPALWNNGEIFPLNSPQWSLFWELIANVAHLLWLRHLSERALLTFLLLMGLSMILATGFCDFGGFGPNSKLWWLALARVGWSYAVGIQIARLYRTVDWRPILPWWLTLLLPIVVVLALPRLSLLTGTGDALLIIILFPLLFWLLVTTQPPASVARWLIPLGALSFPLYAIHLPLLLLFATFDIPRVASAALGATASLLLAIWSCQRGRRDRRGSVRKAWLASVKRPA